MFRLCLILGALCIFLTGCSQLNPFAIPGEKTDKNVTNKKTDEYMEKVEEELEDNEKITDENAENFSNEFDDTTETIYYNAIDKYSTTSDDDGENSIFKSLLKESYSTYNKIRLASPWIMIVSIVLGVIGALFTRHNKGAKKFFIVTFIVAIPVLLLIIVFGIGILNGLFLYNK
jgi:hypothetical protein